LKIDDADVDGLLSRQPLFGALGQHPLGEVEAFLGVEQLLPEVVDIGFDAFDARLAVGGDATAAPDKALGEQARA
jgi:hypothetical protein